MHPRRLGRTELMVSRLGLGTMTFGRSEWGCDEGTAQAIVRRFLDAGGNLLDTADVYSDGHAETIVGRALRGRRDRAVLASKVGAPTGPGREDVGLSRARIVAAIDGSLRRLGTDRLDLYQVHAYDFSTPLEETLRALDDCVRAGKVLHAGCCNWSAWQLARANGLARELGAARIDCLQVQYSLVCRDVEREHLPLCAEEGIGVLAWSPLGGGVLGGRIRRGVPLPADARVVQDPGHRGFLSERNVDLAEALAAAAADLGRTPAQVALAWIAGRPAVTAAITGVRTVQQLEENLSVLELELPGELRQRLDDASRVDLGYPYVLHEQVRALLRSRNRSC